MHSLDLQIDSKQNEIQRTKLAIQRIDADLRNYEIEIDNDSKKLNNLKLPIDNLKSSIEKYMTDYSPKELYLYISNQLLANNSTNPNTNDISSNKIQFSINETLNYIKILESRYEDIRKKSSQINLQEETEQINKEASALQEIMDQDITKSIKEYIQISRDIEKNQVASERLKDSQNKIKDEISSSLKEEKEINEDLKELCDERDEKAGEILGIQDELKEITNEISKIKDKLGTTNIDDERDSTIILDTNDIKNWQSFLNKVYQDSTILDQSVGNLSRLENFNRAQQRYLQEYRGMLSNEQQAEIHNKLQERAELVRTYLDSQGNPSDIFNQVFKKTQELRGQYVEMVKMVTTAQLKQIEQLLEDTHTVISTGIDALRPDLKTYEHLVNHELPPIIKKLELITDDTALKSSYTQKLRDYQAILETFSQALTQSASTNENIEQSSMSDKRSEPVAQSTKKFEKGDYTITPDTNDIGNWRSFLNKLYRDSTILNQSVGKLSRLENFNRAQQRDLQECREMLSNEQQAAIHNKLQKRAELVRTYLYPPGKSNAFSIFNQVFDKTRELRGQYVEMVEMVKTAQLKQIEQLLEDTHTVISTGIDALRPDLKTYEHLINHELPPIIEKLEYITDDTALKSSYTQKLRDRQATLETFSQALTQSASTNENVGQSSISDKTSGSTTQSDKTIERTGQFEHRLVEQRQKELESQELAEKILEGESSFSPFVQLAITGAAKGIVEISHRGQKDRQISDNRHFTSTGHLIPDTLNLWR